MWNKLPACFFVIVSAACGAEWRDVATRLTPGMRVDVQHHGKVEHGIFALANGFEIVVTKSDNTLVAIQQADVERVTALGTESAALGYFANANDQLFPKPLVIFERAGAPAATKFAAKSHWWSKQ